MSDFQFRTRHERDRSFVFKCWSRNLYENDPLFKAVPPPTYNHHMDRIMEHHWQHSQWLMLVGEDVKDYMAGFICGVHTDAAPIIHFVYIRRSPDYRGHGLGRHIINEWLEMGDVSDTVFYSTQTHKAREIATQHTRWEKVSKDGQSYKNKGTYWLGRRWLYNPFALTYEMEHGWWL